MNEPTTSKGREAVRLAWLEAISTSRYGPARQGRIKLQLAELVSGAEAEARAEQAATVGALRQGLTKAKAALMFQHDEAEKNAYDFAAALLADTTKASGEGRCRMNGEVSKSTLYRRARKEREAQERYDRVRCRCGLARVNIVHHVTPEQQAWAGDSGYFDDVDTHEFTEVPA